MMFFSANDIILSLALSVVMQNRLVSKFFVKRYLLPKPTVLDHHA